MKEKKALHLTKDAKNNTFDNCDIEGAQIDGQGTKMIRTRIFNFRKKHSTIWWTVISIIISGIIVGLVLLVIEYWFFVT